jgi:hypothetical protein
MRIPHLLRHYLCSTSSILPLSHKQLPQERIQWLLLATNLSISICCTLPQCAQEPFENRQCTFCRVWLIYGGDKQRRSISPVGRVFDEGSCGEDERRSS